MKVQELVPLKRDFILLLFVAEPHRFSGGWIAAALGLAAVPVGGFWAAPFNEFPHRIAAAEAVLYASLLGHAAV